MPLPFQIESVESMRARFPKCLEKCWIAQEDMEDRPGLHRDYVFDFSNGLRLLISRDKFPGVSEPDIHVSASWEYNEPKGLDVATKMVQDHFHLIGGKGYLRFVGVSPKLVPHWIVDRNMN